MWIIALSTLLIFIFLNGVKIHIKFVDIVVWFENEPKYKYALIPFMIICLKRKDFLAFRKTLPLFYTFIRSIRIDVKLL